jgi:hypothetical protein
MAEHSVHYFSLPWFPHPPPAHLIIPRDNEMGEVCSVHEVGANCCNILVEKYSSKAQSACTIDDNNKMDRKESGGEYGNEPVRGVLPTVYRIKKLKKRPRSNKGM